MTAAEELSALTPREREVLVLLCKGYARKEIGTRMLISVKTVEIHLMKMKRRLGGLTPIEAAVLAAKAGWV